MQDAGLSGFIGFIGFTVSSLLDGYVVQQFDFFFESCSFSPDLGSPFVGRALG